jgi:glutamyl-tRNA reductase
VKIVCVGTSHRRAPVRALEQAMVALDATLCSFRDAVRAGAADAFPFSELVALCTCNRVELYAAARDNVDLVREHLERAFDQPGSENRLSLYAYSGIDAVRHLCRVAAGLDSMVVGEAQIAGQVSRAFRSVIQANGGPPLLPRVARIAAIASRRARRETGIGRGPASVSSIAVQLAREATGGLDGKRVLVLGAGKIGRLACEALREVGGGAAITVANRTLRRAEELARCVGGRACGLDELRSLLAAADVVLASTSSPRPLIDVTVAREAGSLRSRDAPLILIDIAVPRDVDPAVAEVAGIRLFGLDDLCSRLDAHLDERRDQVPAAEAIIEEAVAAWVRSQDDEVAAMVAELYRGAERVRRREVERALDGLAAVGDPVRARIDRLTRALVRRILREPTARLRGVSSTDRPVYTRVARDLFGLAPGPAHEEAPEA